MTSFVPFACVRCYFNWRSRNSSCPESNVKVKGAILLTRV